jgi:hypothetical protein
MKGFLGINFFNGNFITKLKILAIFLIRSNFFKISQNHKISNKDK